MIASYKKVIYDLGANTGLNLPYYLKKADKVVAVEANPVLCQNIKEKFSKEIKSERLAIENFVITPVTDDKEVPFYIHESLPVLSCFPAPPPERIMEFKRVFLPSKPISKIIESHGAPYYIKLDLEYLDAVILRAILETGIRPPFISAESHSVEVFALLVGLGKYQSFNLVDGPSIAQKYDYCKIRTIHGDQTFKFLENSAGPFGVDIQNPWMIPDKFFQYLALEGLGWKDVHATTEIEANPEVGPVFRLYVKRAMNNRLKRMRLPQIF